MTVFGNTAIRLDLGGAAPIVQTVADNLPVALFEVLGQLPLSMIASGLATVLVITLFVTSADSGALVVDMITSGGAPNPPVWQRIFWAACAGLMAAMLLLAGGLQALQTAALVSALPFAVVMLLMCYGLLRALQSESEGSAIDLPEIAAFLGGPGRAALGAVAAEMRDSGLAPELTGTDRRIDLNVPHGDRGTFRYTIRVRSFRAPNSAWAESGERNGDTRLYRAMAYSSEGDQQHDVTGYTHEQLINDLLNRYARFRHARRMP